MLYNNTTLTWHGSGYVGITGAIHACLAGYKVIIYDPDQPTVDSVNSGSPRAGEYLGYIDQNVKELVANGMLSATTDFESIKHNPIHLLAVPTEKDNKPYMNIVKGVIQSLLTTIPDGGIVVVESTLVPGTIDSLKLSDSQKLRFHIAVCPRLDWFADSTKNLTNLPRIIGGLTKKASEVVAELLAPICKDIHKTDYRVAEMAKAGQNALYHIQIIAAYQMAKAYQGHVDMNDVLAAIGLHWRLPNLYLGLGTSGRCVSMGNRYITEGAESIKGDNSYFTLSLFHKALDADHDWREVIGDFITKRFDLEEATQIKILIMGIAYSPNFSDFGNSAGLQVAEYLHKYGWNLSIHDPIISDEVLGNATSVPVLLKNEHISYGNFDVILLATAHNEYKYLPQDIDYMWKKGQVIIDATGEWERYRIMFQTSGVTYIRVGEKGWLDK